MNPMAMMKLKPLLEQFRADHPALPQFLHTAATGVDVGGSIDMKVTNAAGQKIEACIRLTDNDIELFNTLRELLSSAGSE